MIGGFLEAIFDGLLSSLLPSWIWVFEQRRAKLNVRGREIVSSIAPFIFLAICVGLYYFLRAASFWYLVPFALLGLVVAYILSEWIAIILVEAWATDIRNQSSSKTRGITNDGSGQKNAK